MIGLIFLKDYYDSSGKSRLFLKLEVGRIVIK